MNLTRQLLAPLLVVASGIAHAQVPADASSVYLKCLSQTAVLPVAGLHDVFIDLKAKTFTNPNFGTVTPYRDEGPFLISETYTESVQPEKKGEMVLISTFRVNRFTLEFVSSTPALKLNDRGKCTIAPSRL